MYMPQNSLLFSEKRQGLVEKDLGPMGTQGGLLQPPGMPLTSLVRILELVHWRASLRSPAMPSLVPCSEGKVAKELRLLPRQQL